MRPSTGAATRALFHPAEMKPAEIAASVTKSANAPRFSRASHARLRNQPATQAAATKPARDRRRDRGRRGRRQRQAATGAPPRTARADHRETGARRARMSCPQLRPIRPAVPSVRPYSDTTLARRNAYVRSFRSCAMLHEPARRTRVVRRPHLEFFPMSSSVVTRFAPSPTGFLHIGGARTALFNWLYAKKTGGKMLLRIEDTDRERSTDAAIAAILDGLKWLELDWDGEVIYQFSRAARHREVVGQLLTNGRAYRCYATVEELAAMREKARAEGRTRLYDGMWRDRDPNDAPDGLKPTIRLRAPLTGEAVIEDQVQGRVVWQNENLDDLVLLRGDGNPTYMLAVVVDDHDMGVTHIIRGDDHLINAARQKQIYDALSWDIPNMSHIPLIHGPDGAKLSKRHGALGVEAYRAMGYLPAALRNYLVRLGWSHGDQEIFSTQEMIDAFDLPAIGRSAARFDFAKLENLNGHYIRHADDQA